MTLAQNGALTEAASAPDPSSDTKSPAPRSGLGMSAQIAMWVVVVTLCLIALPRGIFDALSGSTVDKSQAQIKGQMQALEARANTAVAAANDAASSARGAAACAASIASGARQARNCAASNPVQAQIPSSSGPTQADPLRPVADIARMTLDASKDKFDSLKDSNDKLFSVLAAMGALLAFLGFKGLDSFMAAKTKAEEAVEKANLAQKNANLALKEANSATDNLNNFLKTVYQITNRAEINVSHGITLREMAAVYKQCWDLQNPGKGLPANGLDQYRAYLNKALYYLNTALCSRNDMDENLILRAMGTQCNVYRRLDDYETALVIARQIIDVYPEKDDSAYYNAACYCSLIGQRWVNKIQEAAPADYSALAIDYLRQAIAMDSENKKEALKDPDFTWLKSANSQEFAELTK